MKATGIVRRVDDLGRIVIPKEIRRTLKIREGDPSQTTLTGWEVFCCCHLCSAYERKAFIDGLQYGAHLLNEIK